MKKVAAIVFVLAAALCSMAGAFAQSDASKEILGSAEDGTVLHKDIIYQNAKPGDYLTRKSGEDRGKVIILKQEDIDYSKAEIGRINEELLDTAPGSIRALLDEIIAGENIEFGDEATEVEEIPYSELSGRVVEYISDIRNGQQTILIVANKKHASFFDKRFSVPPWYKAKKTIPPELIEFILAKKVTSTENRIFSFNEDIEVTKTLIKKPIPQSEKDFKVKTKGGEVTITGYIGSAAAVVIPATIKGKPVTSIGDSAFQYSRIITSVSIPAGVTSIGAGAFARCTGLTSVSIPVGVTIIGIGAFASCTGLASVNIPASVTSIWQNPFSNCTGLTSIQVDTNNTKYTSRGGVLLSKTGDTLIAYPAGLKGQYAIPASVTSIESSVFNFCTGLTAILVDTNNKNYTSRNGVLLSKTGDTLIVYPAGLKGQYAIPASVTSIGDSAFRGCTGLTSVSIPAGVTSIGDWAFSYCTGLTSVSIPASVTSIGTFAFLGCTGLTLIRIGANVKLPGSKYLSFDNKFDVYYNRNGKKAGVYTRRGWAWGYAGR